MHAPPPTHTPTQKLSQALAIMSESGPSQLRLPLNFRPRGSPTRCPACTAQVPILPLPLRNWGTRESSTAFLDLGVPDCKDRGNKSGANCPLPLDAQVEDMAGSDAGSNLGRTPVCDATPGVPGEESHTHPVPPLQVLGVRQHQAKQSAPFPVSYYQP